MTDEIGESGARRSVVEGFITPLGRGMRRVPEADRTEFDGATTDALHRQLDEFDRVRNQGAVDARRHPLH